MVLVTGGAGIMGSVLVRRLAQRGERVRVLTLPGDPCVSRIADCTTDIRYGDVSQASSIAGVCDEVTTVYHLAAVILSWDDTVFDRVNVRGTANVVDEAKRAGVGHFIQVSSASVIYPRPTPYSLSKRAGEEIVKGSGLRWTIIRPTLVYDKGKGAEEYDRFLEYLAKFPVVPFIGAGRALKRPVFVGDLIGGLAEVCGNAAVIGKTYNLSGGEAISILDFARLSLRLMGLGRKPIVKIPAGVCGLIAAAMEATMEHPPLRRQAVAGMTQDADLNPAEAMRDLGYAPARVREKLPGCFPRQR